MATLLSSMGIRIKLAGGLVVLLLLAAGLGVFSLGRMADLNTSAKVVTGNYFPSIVAATEIRGLLYKLRVAELSYIAQTEGADKAKAQSVMAGFVDKYLERRKTFNSLIDPGEETELYARLDTLWTQYLPLHEKLVRLDGQTDRTEIIALSTGPMAEMFGKLTDTTDVDVAYNIKAGAKASASFDEMYESTQYAVWTALAIVALLTVLVGTVLALQIASPLVKITAAMRKLAERDLSTAIPGMGRGDEIGSMAAAVNVFKESMLESAAMAAEQDRLKAEAAASQRAAMHRMADAFETKVGGLIAMVSAGATELQATADSMSTTAQQTRQQASTAAEATTETCAGVQTVATAAEQLSSSIQEIGRQVAQSSEISGRAVADARRTDATVRALAEGAQKIGDVVGLIANIASQTNLLALNATIEAARAGDAGKGFAVVASEVKSLASQTARATQDISAQISGIQSASAEAVQAIETIGATIDQVSGIAMTIASAVEQQGAATDEIARSVQLTASTTLAATGNIESVATAANDTGAAAAQVLGASSTLSMQAEQLRAAVTTFVAEVRAA